MTPDEERCRCVTARGAATLEATTARVAMGAVFVASTSILLDEIMFVRLLFHIMSSFDMRDKLVNDPHALLLLLIQRRTLTLPLIELFLHDTTCLRMKMFAQEVAISPTARYIFLSIRI